MKINLIFRDILKKQNLSMVKLANRMNNSANNIKEKLTRENITINAAVEIARSTDHKILIVPIERKVQDDEYEVEIGEKKTRGR